MPCFFCNSVFHLSEYCDVHISNRSRKKIVKQKKRCTNCLAKNKKRNKFGQEAEDGCKHVCENGKCYICFSNKHSTVFCPDRFHIDQNQFILPKIDADLLPRLFQTFDSMEQFSLAFFYSSKTINLYQLKPMVVIQEMDLKAAKKSTNFLDLDEYPKTTTFLVAEEVSHCNKEDLSSLSFEKNIIFKPKRIILNYSKIYANDFFQLLSPFTKSLYCTFLELTPEISFEELLAKAPNIENIYLRYSNIEYEETWTEVLLTNNCNKLEEIDISNDSDQFDLEKIAAVMKKRKIRINLYIMVNAYYKKKLEDCLPKYFKLVENEEKSSSSLLKIVNCANHQLISFDLLEPI